jgi:hypothetical protein
MLILAAPGGRAVRAQYVGGAPARKPGMRPAAQAAIRPRRKPS